MSQQAQAPTETKKAAPPKGKLLKTRGQKKAWVAFMVIVQIVFFGGLIWVVSWLATRDDGAGASAPPPPIKGPMQVELEAIEADTARMAVEFQAWVTATKQPVRDDAALYKQGMEGREKFVTLQGRAEALGSKFAKEFDGKNHPTIDYAQTSISQWILIIRNGLKELNPDGSAPSPTPAPEQPPAAEQPPAEQPPGEQPPVAQPPPDEEPLDLGPKPVLPPPTISEPPK